MSFAVQKVLKLRESSHTSTTIHNEHPFKRQKCKTCKVFLKPLHFPKSSELLSFITSSHQAWSYGCSFHRQYVFILPNYFNLQNRQLQIVYRHQMIVPHKSQLMKIFNEPTFAWELLQWEIAIEMNESLSGQAIAKLLELYMRGVQKMNSMMDIREAYFKNKVQSLMMKNSVVKTLNKPPMAKKQKPLEVSAKVQSKTSSKTKQQSATSKKVEITPYISQQKPIINTFALQQRKREIEMRLAYEAHQSSRENLTNIYNQHVNKEQKYTSKVKMILNDHQERLKERITRRKLRTATYRSRPEDTSDTFPVQQNSAQKKEMEESFSPRHNGTKPKKNAGKAKRHRSMLNKVSHQLTLYESPKKLRKSFYHENTSKLDEQKEGENGAKQENQYQHMVYQEVIQLNVVQNEKAHQVG